MQFENRPYLCIVFVIAVLADALLPASHFYFATALIIADVWNMVTAQEVRLCATLTRVSGCTLSGKWCPG